MRRMVLLKLATWLRRRLWQMHQRMHRLLSTPLLRLLRKSWIITLLPRRMRFHRPRAKYLKKKTRKALPIRKQKSVWSVFARQRLQACVT